MKVTEIYHLLLLGRIPITEIVKKLKVARSTVYSYINRFIAYGFLTKSYVPTQLGELLSSLINYVERANHLVREDELQQLFGEEVVNKALKCGIIEKRRIEEEFIVPDFPDEPMKVEIVLRGGSKANKENDSILCLYCRGHSVRQLTDNVAYCENCGTTYFYSDSRLYTLESDVAFTYDARTGLIWSHSLCCPNCCSILSQDGNKWICKKCGSVKPAHSFKRYKIIHSCTHEAFYELETEPPVMCPICHTATPLPYELYIAWKSNTIRCGPQLLPLLVGFSPIFMALTALITFGLLANS